MMEIVENKVEISEVSSILPIVDKVKVECFHYKKIVFNPEQKETFYPATGQFIPSTKESFIEYPEGIQLRIDPLSLEKIYPEAVYTTEDNQKYCRIEIIVPLLFQAIKELNKEFSTRLESLEKKSKNIEKQNV